MPSKLREVAKALIKEQSDTGRPPELCNLTDQIGRFIEYWGFKRIHGKIWAHLFLSERPLDAGELMDRLSVSKGLMSLSLKVLLDYQVILVAGKSPRGTIIYEINPDVTGVIVNVLRSREKMMLANVRAALTMVDAISDEEKQRLGVDQIRIEALEEFIKIAQGALDSVIALDRFDLSSWRNLGALILSKSKLRDIR